MNKDYEKQTNDSVEYGCKIAKYRSELSKLCFGMLNDLTYLLDTYELNKGKYKQKLDAAIRTHQDKRYVIAFELYESLLSEVAIELYNPKGKQPELPKPLFKLL